MPRWFALAVAFSWMIRLTFVPLPFAHASDLEPWQAELLDSGDVVHRGDGTLVARSGEAASLQRQVNLAFVLDASGSMNATLAGTDRSRLAVAKEVMHSLMPFIPAGINGSLWVYGHRRAQDPKSESCMDIEQVIELAPFDGEAFLARIDAVTAIGYTPIAASLEQVAHTLPPAAGGPVEQRNAILLVSDGEETCEGEPCALAASIRESAAAVVVHVVGYAVDDATRQQLQCITTTSGGTYADADDQAALLAALERAMEATLSETVLRVEANDPDGEPVQHDLWLFAQGTAPDSLVSGYRTWIDNNVPAGSYDLVIRTLPWIFYPSLALPEGITTTIPLHLAELTVLMPDRSAARFELYDASLAMRLGTYDGTIHLAPGSYAVSVNNSMGEPIGLDPGERRTIVLATVRVLDPGGRAVRATLHSSAGDYLGTYDDDIALVPGVYRFAVNRSMSGSIRVENAGARDIRLGSVRCIAPDGTTAGVTVFDADESRLGHYRDDILLVPGTYVLDVNGSVKKNVTVEGGEYLDLRLGAIEVDARYELYRANGERLGSFNGVTPVFPDIYSVRWQDQVRDGVQVKAGNVARPGL